VVDAKGILLAVVQSGANAHDARMVLRCIAAIEPVPQVRGRPKRRPSKLHADKADDSRALRAELRRRGIQPRIARRWIDTSERLGRYRWVVERTGAWLNRCRRLRIRYEQLAEIQQAFLDFGCARICWNCLQHGFWNGLLVYNLLEGSFSVFLVNAAHVKQVSGRKADKADACWLAKLMRYG
jgi:transposase